MNMSNLNRKKYNKTRIRTNSFIPIPFLQQAHAENQSNQKVQDDHSYAPHSNKSTAAGKGAAANHHHVLGKSACHKKADDCQNDESHFLFLLAIQSSYPSFH